LIFLKTIRKKKESGEGREGKGDRRGNNHTPL
jgi:hypothetical protein